MYIYKSYLVQFSLSPPMFVSIDKCKAYLKCRTKCDAAFMFSSSLIRIIASPKGEASSD